LFPDVGHGLCTQHQIMTKGNIVKLVISLALPLALGFIGSLFTSNSINDGWYASLNQPSFNPPNSIFGPVWTILYILMGISLYMVWKEVPGKKKENALGIFALQLLLNFLWSLFFFYFKDIEIALLDIIALWISIVVMVWLFYRVKPLAGWLNIPYLLWVSFATALNIAYYVLN
jgi:benzodiazapine receptor